ncbi:MAG: hypothetical protein J6N45_05320 [Alphaproteobacteria bacterium]|nr:hypothetical protein [Alphaproteobacteria bacterium]
MRTMQEGRSMIEMLGVLAIIGVLTVGGIAGYTKAMTKYKTNKTKNQITSIVANIRTLYGSQISYNGLNNKRAIQMDIIPEEMIVSDENGQLKNAFGGQVFLGSGSIGNSVSGVKNDRKAFVIEYVGLPRAACTDLASTDWGSGSSSGLIGLKAVGTQKPSVVTSTADGAVDVPEIQFQHGGAVCKGVPATRGSIVACAGGTQVSVPVPVAQAAIACNCGSGNTCSVIWKYF